MQHQEDYSGFTLRQSSILLLSILVVALCGIAYELIIGTVSSYLLGNSVYQFSITIGFFMCAMGIGSYLSRFIREALIARFILIEVVIALIGGISSLLLFIVFPMVNPLYNIVMYSLILIIGTLVGLEIPLLTRILSQSEGTRRSIANVMSLDYLGALIGSVSFPLLLLPELGLIRSSFAIGLLNIATALVNVLYFRKYIVHFKAYLILCIFVLVSVVTFTIAGSRLTSFAEHHLYFDQVIYEEQTLYQKIVVTRARNDKDHRLFIDGHIQFSERDEYRYHEALVHPVMSLPGSIEKVLVLGGGDGLAARELLKYPQIARIDLVDIDPAITRLAQEFAPLARLNQHSLKNPKIHVYNEDAFSFINQPGILYDRVIIDMPDPHNEALNKLYSKEFYTMIQRRMETKGVLVSQSSSPFFTRRTFWCIEETLDYVFGNTYSYHITIPAFGIWGFNLASNQPIAKDFRITAPTRYLTDEVMISASTFGKDIAKINSPVNTIMEPRLYSLYLEDLEH
ncbi:MAG: polyamine aminopropyltransferase [Pseudomonadales bacterium]|nr:polyamine aminopropyltransferase [Pseudomonadales bacterium]